MPKDLTLISTQDILCELGKRAEYLFIAASLPDAQEKAPTGSLGFLTVVPNKPFQMMKTIWMVGKSFKAMARGSDIPLSHIMEIFLGALDDEDEGEDHD